MQHTHRWSVKLGFLFMAIAVGLGAFGAHELKELIDENALVTWETGIRYLTIHAFAMIILGISHRKFSEKMLNLALRLFILGIILFSGSLLLLSTSVLWAGTKQSFLGAITPLGGVSFIAAWLLLFFKGFAVEKDHGGISSADKPRSSSRQHRKHRHSSSKTTETNTQIDPPTVA